MAQGITRSLHVELALALGAVRAGVDVLQIMGAAPLAVSAIVLGASLAQRKESAATSSAATSLDGAPS